MNPPSDCKILVLATNPAYVQGFIDVFDGHGNYDLFGISVDHRELGYNPSILRDEVKLIGPHLVITDDLDLFKDLDLGEFSSFTSNPYVLAASGHDDLRMAFLSGRWPPRRDFQRRVLVIEL